MGIKSLTLARSEDGNGKYSKEPCSFPLLFLLASWVLFGHWWSEGACLRAGAEAGVWGQEDESPPSRETEGSPEVLAEL